MNDPKLERCKQVIKQYEENQSIRSSISKNVIKKINKETPKKKRKFLDIVKDYFPYEVLFS